MATFLICNKQADNHWILTLNRPEKRNALCAPLVEELLACIDQAREANISALFFRGEGRNFSAGFDFSDLETVSEAELLWRFVRVQQLLTAIQNYPGLTIALAHGRNFGAGCDVFASCSVRLATRDARFRMPGVLFGLILGTRHLASLVGTTNAKALQLATQEISAQQAMDIGFVSQCIDETFDLDEWVFAQAKASSKLAFSTRQAICNALDIAYQHEDMGRLVASVMAGNIKTRLQQYVNS